MNSDATSIIIIVLPYELISLQNGNFNTFNTTKWSVTEIEGCSLEIVLKRQIQLKVPAMFHSP